MIKDTYFCSVCEHQYTDINRATNCCRLGNVIVTDEVKFKYLSLATIVREEFTDAQRIALVTSLLKFTFDDDEELSKDFLRMMKQQYQQL